MMASLRAAAVVVVLCMMVMLCTAYVPVCKDKREQDVCKSARCDADYYKRSCRKTCGLCHVCMDVRADCSTLRARCNETWMKQDCSKTCKECKDGNTEDYGIGDDTTTLTATVCLMAPPRGNCIVLRNSWYYEPLEGKCRIFTYGCHDDGNNIFQTEENCNRYCRAFDICRQPNGARSCTRPQSRYYYDSDVNECRQFSGCDGSLNNFISLEACQRKCGPEPSAGKTKEACSLVRHDGVTCTDRFTATNTYWYYDNHSGRCQQFTYTGCGGNGNRFDTEQSCTALCSMSASTTPTPQAVWGEWSPWTECSATCGSGTTTTRTRTCMPPGGTCQGLSTNAVVCNLKACCVLQDGTWSDWNDWSPCSRSCDRGNRRRQRTCSSPNECGRPCAGSNTQDDYCNTQACPSIPQITVRPQTQPFSAGDSVTLTCRSTNTGGARGDLSWSFSPGDIGREQPAVDSIKLQISNLSTELDGTNVTCRERVGAEEKHTSVVIRVDQKAVLGVCKASVNSDNWTIAGFCDVTNVYDSSGQYLCVWQEENYRYYSYASMIIKSFWQMSSDGRKLQKGNCSFLANIPASFFRGSHHIKDFKFRANIGPGSTLSDYVTVPVAYPERPTVTCPGTYLGEGSPFECTCQTSSLGTPVGRLLLKVKDQLEATGSVGETSIRLSRNIRREDSSARVTCLVDWAKNVTGRNEAQLLVSKYAAWGEWDNWSTCSATCGNGTQSRRRTCYPTRSTCHGSNTETASCNFTDCCDVLPSTPRLTMVSPMLAYRCAPRLISSTIMTTEVVEGSDGQFTFDLVAYPLPSVDTFTYRRDNSTSRSQQEPVRSSLLSGRCEDHAYVLHLVTCKVDITGAALNDGGLYSFQARNAEGQQSVTFRLSVTPQDTNSSDQDNPLSFIGFAIAVLVLAFIAALVVFIIKRRSAASGANAEEPTYCNVTMQSVASACASDNNLHDNIEKNTSTQDSKEPGSSKVSDENTVNDLYAVVEKTKTPGFFENSGQPGTSKSPDEDTQNDLYGTVDKSRKAKSAGNKEKQAKPAVMPKPMRKGAAGRKPQENDGDSLSANATDTIRGSGVENVVNNNEAGPCDSQKATANEEGLFYTELDFSQYRPETQRPLPQKEETLYATVDLQKTAATCIKRQH